jgi:hypothetical protein
MADDDTIRMVWNKGARDTFIYHVVHREFDGETMAEGEDWVSMEDPSHQVFESQHYSHEGTAVMYKGLVHFVWASDDGNYTTGDEHDIVIRTLDPATGEWGPVIEVSPNDEGQDRDPEVAVFKGRLYIAWRTNDPGKADGTDEDVVLRSYDGAAFSDVLEVSIPGDDGPDAALDLEVVDDHLVVVWEWTNRTNGPTDWDVLYRRWDGAAFTSDPVVVSPHPGRLAKLPKVAEVTGRPFVVWESRPAPTEQGTVTIRGRVMEGDAPGQVVDITRPGSAAENVQPDVVSAGDKVFILWSSFDDSLTHGPDSDIVMREYDGVALGEVVELSHPRDAEDLDEGFVTGCVFQGNLYAVWRMLYFIDPPIPYAINEDIVIRRVTDFQVMLTTDIEGNPVVGDTVELELTASTFYGEQVDPRDLDLDITVMRAKDLWTTGLILTPAGDKALNGTFEFDRAGTYTFTVSMDGREVATTQVTAHGKGGDGGTSGVSTAFLVYTGVALIAFVLAVVIAIRRR